MKIYRCCGYEEFDSYKKGKKYLKLFGRGTNTFNYEDNSNYIHFFLFAESAYHYSKYNRNRKYFIECDIPFETLKKYYGFGWYEAIIPGYYVPILEFAIPTEEFNIDFISDSSNEIKKKWLRTKKWRQYIKNIPREYLADYEFGSFNSGYDEKSILEVPIENLIGHDFEKIGNRKTVRKLLKINN